MKWIFIVLAVLLGAWFGATTKWDVSCEGKDYNGLYVPPAEISYSGERTLQRIKQPGCIVTARNPVRRLFDRWFVEGHDKPQRDA